MDIMAPPAMFLVSDRTALLYTAAPLRAFQLLRVVPTMTWLMTILTTPVGAGVGSDVVVGLVVGVWVGRDCCEGVNVGL